MIEQLFSSKGRINRLEYFLTVLVVQIYRYAILPIAMDGYEVNISRFLIVCIGIALVLVYWAQTAKRLHDFNQSKTLAILILLPIVGILYVIYLCCRKGDVGPNKYGEEPAALV